MRDRETPNPRRPFSSKELQAIMFVSVIFLATIAVFLNAYNAAVWGFLGMAIGYAVGKNS